MQAPAGQTGVRIRFQADADLKHAIIAGTLRSVATVDFRRAEAVPLEGLDDPLMLAAAAKEGRVLVRHDVNTMELHFRQFIQRQRSHSLMSHSSKTHYPSPSHSR